MDLSHKMLNYLIEEGIKPTKPYINIFNKHYYCHRNLNGYIMIIIQLNERY